MKSAPKTNLVELVEKKILDIIRDRNLSRGDRLPHELTLTEELGVSRSVVREALSRLRMLGLLETRRKRGTVVAEPDILGGWEQLFEPAFLDAQTQKDLFGLRLTMELGLAHLLFQNRSNGDLTRLEKIVEREEKGCTEKARLKMDVQFHSALFKMANNSLISRFHALLEPFFRRVVEGEAEHGRRYGETTHRDLLEELRSGTPESFREAMHKHLRPYLDRGS